jgi:hypothetical protein
MAVSSESAAKLLDHSVPLDVPVLDALIAAFYGAGTGEEVCPRSTLFFLHEISATGSITCSISLFI